MTAAREPQHILVETRTFAVRRLKWFWGRANNARKVVSVWTFATPPLSERRESDERYLKGSAPVYLSYLASEFFAAAGDLELRACVESGAFSCVHALCLIIGD